MRFKVMHKLFSCHLHTSRPYTHSSCRVVITGMGVVTPLGVGIDNVWNKLINGHCGVSHVQGTDDYEGIPCKVAAYVPKEELKLEERFTKAELRTLPMASIYALIATEEALTRANWKPDKERDKRLTGVAIGMGMVELNEMINTVNVFQKSGFKGLSPHFVTKIMVNTPAGHVSIKYGLKGPNHCVSTACTTGAHAIGDAFNFIQRGSANIMVCGGTESVISPLSMAAFAKIRALSTKFNDAPTEASRPFDRQRCGFVMGEGCGVMILEELNHALSRNAHIYGEILGYGLSGDANHITAPREDGSGALQCMESAIDDANVKLNEIGHINAHATSTPLGDAAEIKAVMQLFGEEHTKEVTITSTKGATGHLLGASGSVEAIFTLLSCYHSIFPPTINLEEACDCDITIIANKAQSWKSRKRIAITNSFGFGGTNASLVISNFLL